MSALPGPAFDHPPLGVELLERSLAYTRAALVSVGPQHLCLPTPCDLWRLGDLLAHMEDALDAFAEGAGGAIDLHSRAPAPLQRRIVTLQEKACSLLGAWLAARSPYVDVAGHPVAVDTIARLASVEITVHGWDVGRVTGHGAPIPDALAAELLPTATALALDHPAGFAAPVPVPDAGAPSDRLLAILGRRA